MNIGDWILPRINDLALAKLQPERRRLVECASGRVLAHGMGTGLNLEHYTDVQTVTGVEPAEAMRVKALDRAKNSKFAVHCHEGFAEKLPFHDNSFDSVVSTFVLCSVRDLTQSLREIYRVLVPGGRFFMLEHVRSMDPKMAKWQDRVDPVWKVVLGGCHPNRDTGAYPEKVGFKEVEFEYFLAPQPALAAPHVRAVFEKPTESRKG